MAEQDDDLSAAEEKIERLRGLLININKQNVPRRPQAELALRKIRERARDLLEYLETKPG